MHLLSFDAQTLLACLATCALSCLPSDTRPPPGTLLVAVTSSQALLDGIPSSLTEDGWSVAYDKFLVSFGGVSLDGDRCSNYSGFGYDRIVNMKMPGPQKVALLYALGSCEFGFGISNPDSEAVLGANVSEQDRMSMRTPGNDRYTLRSGISILVQGSATRGNVTKTFAWSFRQPVRYRDCSVGDVAGFTLDAHETETATIGIAGETLLQDDLDASRAKLRFDVFVDGDARYGNDDGEITLEELGRVPLADLQVMNLYLSRPTGSSGNDPTRSAEWKTFEDYLYLGLVPRTARFQMQGSCSITLGGDEGRGRGGP
jgi:hypothetical protein